MHFNRRMTASLIALAAASTAALAVGSASVGASSAQVPGVSKSCLEDVAGVAPGLDGNETTAGSLPLVGQALGGGLLGAGGSDDSRARTLECAGVDIPSDKFLIDHIRIRPGG